MKSGRESGEGGVKSEEWKREWRVGSGESEHTSTHNTVVPITTSKLHFMNKTTDMYSWHKPPSVSHADMYTPPTTRGFLYVCMYAYA